MPGVDEEVIYTLNSLDSRPLEDPSEKPIVLPPTLETLPNELLSSIVLDLDGFVLPPLSRRLLPFHRSSLFRKTTLDLKQFDFFYYTLEFNPQFQELIEEVSFNFAAPVDSSSHPSIPRRRYQNELLSSLPNLKRLTITLGKQWKARWQPTLKDFERNPRLETLIIKSSFRKFSNVNTEEEEDETQTSTDPFDFGYLGSIDETEIQAAFGFIAREDPRFPEPEVFFEVRRNNLSSPELAVRYFGVASSVDDLMAIAGCLTECIVSSFELVYFASRLWLAPLIATLGEPCSLKKLSIYTVAEDSSRAEWHIDHALTSTCFCGLTHLSIGGPALPDTDFFFDTILNLQDLEYLRIGPQTTLYLDLLIQTFPYLNELKTLVLDNVPAGALAEGDIVFEADLPEFPEECLHEEVEEMRLLAEGSGVKVEGSTFEAACKTRRFHARMREIFAYAEGDIRLY